MFSWSHLCVADQLNLHEGFFGSEHQNRSGFQYVYIYLSYVHMYIHIYIYIDMYMFKYNI